MYHVKFRNTLSPPDLFDTIEQAHEFFLSHRDEGDEAYDREEVRPAKLGDLITERDLVSSMRENTQRLFGDDSFMDSPTLLAKQALLHEAIQGTLDAYGEKLGLAPDGLIVVGVVRVATGA